jgi:hypothetical protein
VRYFREDEDAAPEFRDTAILNPDWVTEAVYRVLEDGKLKQTHGLVTAQDLDRITRALKHPAGSFRLIEEVMRRFSQLYDTQDGRMFVPHLLEDRESPVEWPAGALRFMYRYPVLPAGLMPAFIARMHNYHDEAVSPWRKGCVLSVQGCRVRVIGDRKARTVEIEVAGEMADRRRDALDHIRYAFEDMHRVFAGAQVVEELMPVPGHPGAPMLNYQGLRTLERKGVAKHSFPADAAQSDFVEVDIPGALGGVRTPAREERERVQDSAVRHGPEPMVMPPLPPMPPPDPVTRRAGKESHVLKAVIVGAVGVAVVAALFALPWWYNILPLLWAVITAAVIYHDPCTFFRRMLYCCLAGWLGGNALGFKIKIADAAEISNEITWGFNIAAAIITVALVFAAHNEAKRHS